MSLNLFDNPDLCQRTNKKYIDIKQVNYKLSLDTRIYDNVCI